MQGRCSRSSSAYLDEEPGASIASDREGSMIPVKNNTRCESYPWIVLLLGVANCIVFLFELSLSPGELEDFFGVFGIVPADMAAFRIKTYGGLPHFVALPFLTSQFIHGDFFHLLMNLWTLYLFAPCVEDRLGHLRFLFFYLSSGIGSGLIHTIINSSSTVPTVGASGSIAGVLGAYFILLAILANSRTLPVFFLPLFFEVPAFFYLIFWFLSQLHSGTWALVSGVPDHGGIAFWAHIGGFLTGIYLLSIFYSIETHKSNNLTNESLPLVLLILLSRLSEG